MRINFFGKIKVMSDTVAVVEEEQHPKPIEENHKDEAKVLCSCGIGIVRKNKGKGARKPRFKLVEV